MDRWIYWHTNQSTDRWVWMDRKKDLRGGQKGQGQGTYRIVYNLDHSREEGQIQGKARLVSEGDRYRHKQETVLAAYWR